MLRIIITAGGTGGHVFPALAVAEELQRQLNAEIIFMGSNNGPEQAWVEEAGYPFIGLPVKGVLGRGFRALSACASMGISILAARKAIKKIQPNIVIGFGGYASFAGVFAAALKGIPSIIHEQNAVPGVSNKILARFVKKVCLSMEDVKNQFPPAKVVFTGNPVRPCIACLAKKGDRIFEEGSKKLLVMGGSQGSRPINNAMLAHLEEFKSAGIKVWHQTGKNDYANVRAAYEAIDYYEARVSPFIDDMAAAYVFADMVLCRSGASTIAELCAIGLPAVLVPYPHATNNHQFYNALYMADNDAAIIVTDEEMSDKVFVENLLNKLLNTAELKKMSLAAKSLGSTNAAANVVNCVIATLPQHIKQEE